MQHKHQQELQQRLLAILDTTSDLVALNDMQGHLCYLNRAGRLMLGIGEEEDITTAREDSTASDPEKDASWLLDDLFPIGVQGEVWRTEKTLRARDGHEIPVSQVVISHKDAEGKVVYLSTIARDISERKAMDEQIRQQVRLIRDYSLKLEAQKEQMERANAELEEANRRLEALAVTDGLTGLKNHRAFQERLVEECRRSARYHQPLSLLLLDVDHFKQFNDTFGHPAGDEVLKRVSTILQANVRTTDFVARYGGEEFAILLPETDAPRAIEAAERIRAAVAQEEQPQITVSGGVASLQNSAAMPSLLVQEADRALYVSKSLGRNRVTHHQMLEGVAVNAVVQAVRKKTAR